MSTMGHVMDLPTKKIGVSVNDSIEIEYVPIENKEKTIVEICKAASAADEIYLAPDPTVRGRSLLGHIEQAIKKVAKNQKIHRITF